MEKIVVAVLVVGLWVNVLGGYQGLTKAIAKVPSEAQINYYLMEQVVAETEIQFYELNIQGWTKLKQEQLSTEELEQLARLLRQEIDPSLTFQRNGQRVSGCGVTEQQGEINMVINNNEDGAYLEAKMVFQDEDEAIACYQGLNSVFSQYGSTSPISFGMVGIVEEELSSQATAYLTQDLLNNVEGVLIEESQNESLQSYSGYVEGLAKPMNILGKEINLQVAYRQNIEEKNTKIYIATPLIFGDY